jgi:hypothetical protein
VPEYKWRRPHPLLQLHLLRHLRQIRPANLNHNQVHLRERLAVHEVEEEVAAVINVLNRITIHLRIQEVAAAVAESSDNVLRLRITDQRSRFALWRQLPPVF